MTVMRRAPRPVVTLGAPAKYVPPRGLPAGEIMYKGHRIEPASYCVNATAWSPRAVVSVRTEDGWSRQAPLYATDTARFPTRDDADRRALDVARAWIDTAVER
jgi:hypothetical protein